MTRHLVALGGLVWAFVVRVELGRLANDLLVHAVADGVTSIRTVIVLSALLETTDAPRALGPCPPFVVLGRRGWALWPPRLAAAHGCGFAKRRRAVAFARPVRSARSLGRAHRDRARERASPLVLRALAAPASLLGAQRLRGLLGLGGGPRAPLRAPQPSGAASASSRGGFRLLRRAPSSASGAASGSAGALGLRLGGSLGRGRPRAPPAPARVCSFFSSSGIYVFPQLQVDVDLAFAPLPSVRGARSRLRQLSAAPCSPAARWQCWNFKVEQLLAGRCR